MLGHAVARKPAPMLAMRPIGLRLRRGPVALGNALGSSIADSMQSAPDQSDAETARLNRYEGAALAQEAANNRTSLNAFNRENDPYYNTPAYESWPDQTEAESARLNRYEANARDAEYNAQEKAIFERKDRDAVATAARKAAAQRAAAAAERSKLSPEEQAYKTYMAYGGRSSLTRIPSDADIVREAQAMGFFDPGEGSGPAYPEYGTRPDSSLLGKLARAVKSNPIGEVLSAAEAPLNWASKTVEGMLRANALAQTVGPEMTIAAGLNDRIAATQQEMLGNVNNIRLPRVDYVSSDGLGPFVEGGIDVGLLGSGTFGVFRATGALASESPMLLRSGLTAADDVAALNGGVSDVVALARMRQQAMLQENIGYNISPIAWDQYPTIGRNGTFISDRQGVMGYFGDLKGANEITVSPSVATQIESDMGLVPGTLQDGFKVRQVTGIRGLAPTSPMEGNQFFLGPGNHLPGGAPEMVIRSIPTVDNQAVTTVLKVKVDG